MKKNLMVSQHLTFYHFNSVKTMSQSDTLLKLEKNKKKLLKVVCQFFCISSDKQHYASKKVENCSQEIIK